MKTDDAYMERALALAAEAEREGEVPVGAVVVHEDRVVGAGYNQREGSKNPLAHAELVALAQAAQELDRWRLSGCTLYVTLEPCPMCAGALVNARIDTVVFGARDPRAGAVVSHFGIGTGLPLNHTFSVREGILGERCGEILTGFFAKKRLR